MRRTLEISTDIIELGEGMFASSDWKVICRGGSNYYLACGEVVIENRPEGGSSTCIKPVGHLMTAHEDAGGHTIDQRYGMEDMDSRVRNGAHRLLRQTGIEETEIFNVLNALQYGGFTLSRGK